MKMDNPPQEDYILTRRDYFAVAAMQGIIASCDHYINASDHQHDKTIEMAFRIADKIIDNGY